MPPKRKQVSVSVVEDNCEVSDESNSNWNNQSNVRKQTKLKKAKVDPLLDVNRGLKYWLMKSEPDVYSIESLQRENRGDWDGVRNYQARNFIRTMKDGDICFLYHSSCKSPGIYGQMKVVGDSFPDKLAIDKSSKYFDVKANQEVNPWSSVTVEFVAAYNNPLLLSDIRTLDLGQCPLTSRGSRLSIMPLTDVQFKILSNSLANINP